MLFPKEFRARFVDEMTLVFSRRAEDAWSETKFPLRFYLREFQILPSFLLQEHIASLVDPVHKGNSVINDLSPLIHKEHLQMGDDHINKFHFSLESREIIVALLPPILLGTGITAASLITGKPWYTLPQWRLTLSIVVLLASGAIIGCGAIYALFRRLPDWGYTWLGTALMGTLLFIQTITGELVDEGKLIISSSTELILALLLMIVAIAIGLISSWRGWQRAGLFSISLVATFALALWQAVVAAPINRFDVAIFALPLALVIAGLIYLYMTRNDRTRALVLVGIMATGVFAILIATTAWNDWLGTTGKPSPLVPLLVLITIMLIAGPIAALVIQPIRNHFQREKV